MDQGLALVDARVSHFTHKDVVVTHLDAAMNGTFDLSEAAGQEGDTGDAGVPFQPVEAGVALAGEAFGQRLLRLI
jgi:hypothetical protein